MLAGISAQMASRHIASAIPQIALVGPPNVGKSSLFNALVTRFAAESGHKSYQLALVSPQRGTTRDYVSATISANGVACELIDTAGIDRAAASTVDSVAQTFALERSKQATIRASCVESSGTSDDSGPRQSNAVAATECDLIVMTKADLVLENGPVADANRDIPVVITSSWSGRGLADLCAAFHSLLMRQEVSQRGSVVGTTADRCRESVRLALESLQRAAEIVRTREGNELVAVELRAALNELGRVVGAVYTDDLLDRIFSTFCIGK